MELAAAVVSYHPTSALLGLVRVLLGAGVPVTVVDNASDSGLDVLAACREAGADVTVLDSNTGVAGALAVALAATTAEWLLTFDQDSVVTAEALARLTGSGALGEQMVAVVAPVVRDATTGEIQGDSGRSGWYETERVITSGALCRVAALRAVGGFRTDLVIDLVDWDLCARLRAAAWRIAIEPTAVLDHSLGRATTHRVPLLGAVTTTNHAPDRQYYKYRNFLLLARSGGLRADARWSARTALGLGLGVGKVIAFEDAKGAKLAAIAAGLRDGVAGRGGPRPRGRLERGGGLARSRDARGTPGAEQEGRQQPERVPVSVCMATYNGAAYLRVQVDSILAQLGPDDELLVQDDGSTDETLAILDGYGDARVQVVVNEQNLGAIGTFERCLPRARHEIVFLADQDDEWLPGKVDAVVAAFGKPGVTAVVTEAVIVDAEGRQTAASYFAHARSGPGVLHNFVKNSYLGCCMAVRREVVGVALPVPRAVRTHDGWIGITADLMGDVVFLPTPYLRYRRHDSNVSQMERFGLPDIVRRRLALAANLVRIAPRALRGH